MVKEALSRSHPWVERLLPSISIPSNRDARRDSKREFTSSTKRYTEATTHPNEWSKWAFYIWLMFALIHLSDHFYVV